MRKLRHILAALIICVTMIGCLASCEKEDYALKIGKVTISKEQYKIIAMSLKSQFLTENNIEETADTASENKSKYTYNRRCKPK